MLWHVIYVEKDMFWWFSCDYGKKIVAFMRNIHDMFRLVKKIDLDNEKDKESYEKHHEKDWL